jgi:ketosteroid isomerase-like protein
MAIERAPEIERLVEESRRAYRDGDAEALRGMTSTHPAALMVGTDPQEIRKGHDAIVSSLTTDLSMTSQSGLEFIAGETTAYSDGDLGWATTFGAFRLKDGTEIPTRSVSILSREDGRWKFLQGTISLAVPNSMLEVGSPLAQAFASAKS